MTQIQPWTTPPEGYQSPSWCPWDFTSPDSDEDRITQLKQEVKWRDEAIRKDKETIGELRTQIGLKDEMIQKLQSVLKSRGALYNTLMTYQGGDIEDLKTKITAAQCILFQKMLNEQDELLGLKER